METHQPKTGVRERENQTLCRENKRNQVNYSPHGENLTSNNVLIDIDGACCKHVDFFLEAPLWGWAVTGCIEQRLMPLIHCNKLSGQCLLVVGRN